MRELEVTALEKRKAKRKNTRLWIIIGLVCNIVIWAAMVLMDQHDILGIILIPVIMWVLIISILIFTNQCLGNVNKNDGV